jgi:hypothetical protein
MASPAPGELTVFLHIGPPKTGTTFIQGTLTHWANDLKTVGIVVPGTGPKSHYLAALDARGRHSAGHGAGADIPRGGARGAWKTLLNETLKSSGTAIISHELFSTADDEHAAGVIKDLGGTDLHIVVTARDPARQVVSTFQQRIKQGHTHDFVSVIKKIERQQGLNPVQRLPELTDRWGGTLEPDHVHIVTVPPPGAPFNVLWERFAGVVGIDPTRFGPAALSSNESLGVVETELLRQVNAALDGRLPHPRYGRFVNALYRREILASAPEPERMAPPESMWPFLERMADEWITSLSGSGYDIRGDLSDLRPHHQAGTTPDSVEPSALAAAAVRATAELLLHLADRDEANKVETTR